MKYCKTIDHTTLIKECNSNMDKTEYESNLDDHVVKPSKKIESYWLVSEEYWLASICDEIIWFHFQCVVVCAEFKMKEPPMTLSQSFLGGLFWG